MDVGRQVEIVFDDIWNRRWSGASPRLSAVEDRLAAFTSTTLWREYNTNSRRTSLIIDPPDGRLPPRTAQARPVPVQRCGSLQRGEPCDTYEDYGLGVRCIGHFFL